MIKKSNELIQARYKLSLEEQRLVLLLASTIHKNDEDFKDYEIRVADFISMFGLERKKAVYQTVEAAAKELVGKRLELSRNGKKVHASWLAYAEYMEGSGLVKLRFDKSLKPYLLQLKENIVHDNIQGFTKYYLKSVIHFKSLYSIRLYELLKMEVWKAEKAGSHTFDKIISVDEYRLLLGLEPQNYPIFADLKRWIIVPPVKEVSEQTELDITETHYLKTGRKITAIKFVVVINKTTDSPLLLTDDTEPESPLEEEHPIVQKLMQCGFTAENARSLRHQYGIKRIERTLDYMHAEQSNGKRIVSAVSYLTKAIQEDWGQVLAQEKALQATKRKQQEAAEKQRKAQEQKERAALKQLHQQVLATFNQSPAFVKKMILDAFQQEQLQDNPLLLGEWRTAARNGADAFQQSPMLCGTFTSFLIEKQFY